MDPMNRGPEDHRSPAGDPADAATPAASGVSGDGPAGGQGQAGDPLAAAEDKSAPRPARAVRLVSGDLLVTVNPVDGSEVEPCPPDRRPPRPVKRTAAERAELARAARPPLPSGPLPSGLPLLERDGDRARLGRLLSRGRSVRLTGPSGSGRSTLLDAVAEDCAGLAPDGVIRLSGHRRTVKDVLHELFRTVYRSDLHRPAAASQGELVREIGAVVILDDLEFGGSALDELLDATPECAFALATTPDVTAPSADSHLEEIFLGGLGRGAGMELLRHTVGRELTEEETEWAGDLWFESGGLPARFVQAGALLRRRDQLRAGAADPAESEAAGAVPELPLPSLAEGPAPVALLASLLSASARTALRFAVALGGEVPHRAQLPALLSEPRADAALAELLAGGLITPVGGRYRLAAGVQAQLEASGFADDAEERARVAGEHYAWWAGHPSVGPERVLAEADAVLAALAALIPRTTTQHTAGGERSLAVRLARTAAPAFAAGLDWGVWERALRSGQEAARRSGEVAEEAYFHHELGVLALCHGRLDRARAELEASIGLRGALADKRGTVAGRRALALVEDRSRPLALPPGQAAPMPAGPVPDAQGRTPSAAVQTSFAAALPAAPGAAAADADPVTAKLPSVAPSGTALTARLPAAGRPEGAGAPDSGTFGARGPGDGGTAPLVGHRGEAPGDGTDGRSAGHRRTATKNTRRNLAAAGAGAVLAAVLGTVVTLGATSDHDEPSTKVGPDPSMSQDDGSGITADQPAQSPSDTPDPTGSATSGSPSASDSRAPGDSTSTAPGGGSPHRPTTSSGPTHQPSSEPPTESPSHKPPTSRPPTSKPPSQSPSSPPSGSPTDDPSPPGASDSASGPVPSTTVGSPTGTDAPPSSASASSTLA
ncbi:ABC transporter ATP-binding protein [Streptomyces sulfonofaciens]|nr:ABC transporter ATP-binding protein [Streptomyces sulfonofaciens]